MSDKTTVCTDCDQECDTKRVKEIYDVPCASAYDGLQQQTEWVEVSECCEADFVKIDSKTWDEKGAACLSQ